VIIGALMITSSLARRADPRERATPSSASWS
jgi:hypothetical protein